MSDWRDKHREHKEETGLSWSDYHDRHFVHTEDLEDMQTAVADLAAHVEAVTNSYDDLKRELSEVRIMLESEEFDP